MSDEQRHPWWQVTAVFDPDGGGSDFSYTEGLAREGVPELHLWARPSLGDDPGLDWRLSLDDTGRILNELAWRLLDDRLSIGDTWERDFDGGLTTARFEVGDAVRAEEVEAYGAGDAPVLPIRWELRRDPLGPLTVMSPPEERAADSLLGEVLGGLEAGAVAPQGWELPAQAEWAVGQRFGPRTPLVLARAAQLWQADEDALERLLGTLIVLNRHRQVGYAAVVARAAARSAGRLEVLDRVQEAAVVLVDGFGVDWAVAEVPALRAWLVDDLPPTERDGVWAGVLSALSELVTTFLVVEAAADLMPEQYLVWGQGPTLTALHPTVTAPDPRMACSPSVEAVVREVLRAAGPPALERAALAWADHKGSEAELELERVRMTGATHAPLWWDVLEPAAALETAVLLSPIQHGAGLLQEWANALAAVLSERNTLDPATVAEFLESASHLDGIDRLVDEPVVA